jgi:hypothetical protein
MGTTGMHSDQPAEEAQEHALTELHARALQCRRLAASIGDQRTADTLKQMAKEYEEQARQAENIH